MVQWVRGGVDLHIRFELWLITEIQETTAVDQEFFTCNQAVEWVRSQRFDWATDKIARQTTVVFNAIYLEAAADRLPIAARCTERRCRSKYCLGVHSISGRDLSHVPVERLSGVPLIGNTGIRCEIVKAIHRHYTGVAA